MLKSIVITSIKKSYEQEKRQKTFVLLCMFYQVWHIDISIQKLGEVDDKHTDSDGKVHS